MSGARGGSEQGSEALADLLDRIEEVAREESEPTVESILEAIGRRSFGPLLLVAGLATLAPLIGDIPGVPTLIGITVLLLAVQLLLGRDRFWVPRWMLRRSVDSKKLLKAVSWLERPTAFLERFIRPRIEVLTGAWMTRAIAAVCLLIAAAMPPMELIPFSANLAGAALTAFGLALISRDGVLALMAFAFTGGLVTVIAVNLF